jgi:hypothetical protein
VEKYLGGKAMDDSNDKFENFTKEDDYIRDTEPTMNFFQRVIGIIIKPSETMEDINKKTNVLPAIFTVAVVFLLTVLGSLGPLKDMLTSQYETMGMDYSAIQSSMNMVLVISAISAVVMSVLAPLAKAGASHMISAIYDCEGNFGKTFAVVIYSYLILALGALLKLPIVNLTNNYIFDFNAAIFLPSSSVGTTIHTALSLINVFVFWYLGVTIIGLKKVHKYSTVKAAVAAIIPWLLASGISIALIAMSTKLGQF